MKLLIDIRCPENWESQYAALVRDVLRDNDIGVASVEMIR